MGGRLYLISKKMNNTANMPTYSVTHARHQGMVCVAVYELPQKDKCGRLVSRLRRVVFNERSTGHFIRPMMLRLPSVIALKETGIPDEFRELHAEKCVVSDTTCLDLSFAYFWNTYAYKVGNKATVEKKWNALKPEDRLLALRGITLQRRHSESHRTDMPYPQTYIDQRRWENEFNS